MGYKISIMKWKLFQDVVNRLGIILYFRRYVSLNIVTYERTCSTNIYIQFVLKNLTIRMRSDRPVLLFWKPLRCALRKL